MPTGPYDTGALITLPDGTHPIEFRHARYGSRLVVSEGEPVDGWVIDVFVRKVDEPHELMDAFIDALVRTSHPTTD